jgi:hypothetical protein
MRKLKMITMLMILVGLAACSSSNTPKLLPKNLTKPFTKQTLQLQKRFVPKNQNKLSILLPLLPPKNLMK